MNNHEDLLMDISILYRSTQKYYDRKLEPFHLTYAQLPILLFIFEQEGITMQNIVEKGSYDKGTVTKNIKKLEALDYVEVRPSASDKRVKHLYTTYKAKRIIAQIYKIRIDWWNHIIQNIDDDTMRSFEAVYGSMCERANEYAKLEPEGLRFYGWKKLSLHGFGARPCSVLEIGGCNLRCPGCQKKHLVFLKEGQKVIHSEEVKTYLTHHKTHLHAVAIEGGEVGLHPELESFLQFLKAEKYAVKIKTNGMYPEPVARWAENGLLDEVEIDLKSAWSGYSEATGIHDIDTSEIKKTLDALRQANVFHRFATTLIREFHNEDVLKEMASIVGGNGHWVWRNYEPGANAIEEGLHGFSKAEIDALEQMVGPLVKNLTIERGAQ